MNVILLLKKEFRNDPFLQAFLIYFGFYINLYFQMPKGGVDVFGCNMTFRDELLKLKESRSSLIFDFWLGFRRKEIDYNRLVRQEGVSSQNWSRKIQYMLDSIFSFTDFPIRMLIFIGRQV